MLGRKPQAWRRATIGISIALSGAVVGLAPAPAWAAPSATGVIEGNQPARNLESGATVMVTVTGFDGPGLGFLTMVQCPVAATAISSCMGKETEDLLVLDLPSGGGGNLPGTGTSPFEVEAAAGVCDATHPCAIFVLENPDNFGFDPGNRFATIAITFAGHEEGPHPIIPEVGPTVMLPLAAVAVVGIALAARRRRVSPGSA